MIERILEHVRGSSFDFRRYACPADPECAAHDGFDEQALQFRLLEAIGSVLHPGAVLQLDCGYGYGALAMLRGCPSAHVFGLDPNCGATSGALDWPRTSFSTVFATTSTRSSSSRERSRT